MNKGEWLPCACEHHTAPPVDAAESVTPTGVLITEAAPETPEWFAARREGITGTDLPKILGLSKYGNALSVWLDKRGELSDEAGEAARWGQILEDPVAQEWAHRRDAKVTPVGVLAHRDHPWLRASLDRLLVACPDGDEQCGLEIKTRSAFVSDQWRDGMPDSVLAQVAWGRLVSGLHHMHVAALIGGQRLVAFRYDRDEVLEQYLIDQARPVWEAVEQGIPPETRPDSEGVLLDLLDQLYRSREGDREIPVDEAERWLAQYADGGDLERQGKALKTEAKTALVQLLGDGATGCVDDVPLFTYKPDPAKDTVTADNLRALKNADPDQYAALRESGLITTTDPRPTFRVKPRKKTA
jgi:putative phage-type endonuclease